MNDLLKTSFIKLLTKSIEEVTNEKMQNAYDCFLKQVKSINQSESNYSEAFRTLYATRVELVSLESLNQYEQEKKCD